jgi:signal transduction histidine kinase
MAEIFLYLREFDASEDENMSGTGKLLQDKSTAAVLSNLLGRIVHDFNNPLAAIIGFADLLRNPQLPLEKRSRYVERIFEQASKMAQLVETMSHFAGSPTPAIGPVVLGRTIRESCALRESGFLAARTVLHTDIDIGDRTVEAERGAIGKIIHALLNNAEQVFRENPLVAEREVWVRCTEVEAGIAVDVTDNGPGVPQDISEDIFEPFFSTRRSGGLGLGLTISRTLAEQMGGTLELIRDHDNPGGGACFRLTLPTAKEL